MGTWSERPTDNDQAQEWLANSVAFPLIAAISNAIARFLEDFSDDVKKAEAEAAVALLLELTADAPNSQLMRFSINYSAHEQGLWDKATAAIVRLQSDEKWLSAWSNPGKKAEVLNSLLKAIEER